ncbi:bifunctional 4-hydroxy-2-oxoglutarate aldolase/2-dehydro-3-deoxy-phosphogluconate aldolase [Leeuwenhoekiella sp. MAR_2009_132]|uniref:bifunctional 4-hydroxy-2-oxoglutarate aldolase/2-dehydro-3-deoxy-phosphogluconate aldolase n=1 Tax=Leeuwenhoekiella sp. MAR_2009_132 TaxID=1392489 RepID=UPI0004915A5A|nr:bifunctional 4-hydroxy-2-oxoglutarate aldolase/2-dehydro-3-deoxy-phosphogluconate aldolase [Leeuwenhoekiella sp. MAR_2009_132]
MSKHNRIEVALALQSNGFVPLFYDEDINRCRQLVTACYIGGARILEFTARGDFAHEVFYEVSKFIKTNYSDMFLGVGSITDAAAASLYMQLGADFIVTPALREDIAEVCNRRKVLWLPGCGSVKEINDAEALGCEIIKLFPGSIYGPEFVKAVKGPQPWTSIMPTGGVIPTQENLKSWFDAGVTCVGLGSQLIGKSSDGSYDYKAIEANVKDVVTLLKTIRS